MISAFIFEMYAEYVFANYLQGETCNETELIIFENSLMLFKT